MPEDYPDAYQYERAARFGVCPKAIWYALGRLGVTYKKALRHPKASDEARQTFRQDIAKLKVEG
jgi:hypothetical protein